MVDLSRESKSVAAGSHLILRVLTPAIRLWLNTQIEKAQGLQIEIESSDRQILGGYIPSAQVAARAVVYQGLHFDGIDVVAHNIRTNGLRILRGHAFKLLEPLPIDVNLVLTESDLNQSLQTDLFANAVGDLMQRILIDCLDVRSPQKAAVESLKVEDGVSEERAARPLQLAEPYLSLQPDRIVVYGQFVGGDRPSSLSLETGLSVMDGRTLRFDSPDLRVDEVTVQGRSLQNLENFSIDLGETTEMSVLTISDQCLTCQGRILVMP